MVILVGLILGGVLFVKDRFERRVLEPSTVSTVEKILVDQVAKAGISIDGLPITLGETIEASISGYRVLFSKDKDIKSQVRALQLVLPKITMNRIPKEIDLRFGKVVLKY